jgi:hypothetical protein
MKESQMGVNCTVELSPKATWEYVGMVASKLLGAKATKEPIGTSFYAIIEGFNGGSFKPTSFPQYIYILVSGDVANPAAKLIQDSDGLPYHMWYGLESRWFNPKATAAKIALAKGIVKFFGGKITYNDSTDKEEIFKAPSYIGAADGFPWQRLHQEIIDLPPLSIRNINECEKWAAYK